MEIHCCQFSEHTEDTCSFTGKQRCLGTELKATYASHVWIGVEREWQSEEIYAKPEETESTFHKRTVILDMSFQQVLKTGQACFTPKISIAAANAQHLSPKPPILTS